MSGTPFFSIGLRPMFLSAACWAAISMMLWIGMWTGAIGWAPAWDPLDWHVHELLFGYGGVVLCGFMLTAIPNWTGRAPVAGAALAGLWSLWLAGRVAIGWPEPLPWALVMVLDVSFLVLTAAIAAREILAAGNRRNLPVAAMCGVFALANLLFHLDVRTGDPASTGTDAALGISLLIMLIGLIGGRIIPVFTTNWLKQAGLRDLPVPFGKPDMAVLILSAIALLGWIFAQQAPVVGWLLILAGLAHCWRLSRWRGLQCLSEPLIAALHLAYVFVPVGFLLTGAAILAPQISPMAGVHAWTVGAIGGMTLIVMTRASLGHTGRALQAGAVETAFLIAIALSALTRILSSLGIWPEPLLHLSATLWITGFALFALRFARVMIAPRIA